MGICLVSNDVINSIGVFDEKFNPYGWEDVDFSLRARRHGYKIFYNTEAIIYHKGGKKGRGPVKEYELAKVKNYFYLLRKHANYFQLAIVFSLLPLKVLCLVAKELYRGEVKILLAQFRGVLSLFKQS